MITRRALLKGIAQVALLAPLARGLPKVREDETVPIELVADELLADGWAIVRPSHMEPRTIYAGRSTWAGHKDPEVYRRERDKWMRTNEDEPDFDTYPNPHETLDLDIAILPRHVDPIFECDPQRVVELAGPGDWAPHEDPWDVATFLAES